MLALYGQILLNKRPNLGDVNPESYAKHSTDPAQFAPGYGAGYIVPRVATLRPFSMGPIYRHHFEVTAAAGCRNFRRCGSSRLAAGASAPGSARWPGH